MKSFLSSKIVAILLVLFVLFMGKLKYDQYMQQRAIQTAKQELLDQQAQEEQKGKQLTQSLQMLNSDDFKEKVARGQLNMKKDGELVFNFAEKKQTTVASLSHADANLSNPQKWWNYFFNNNQ